MGAVTVPVRTSRTRRASRSSWRPRARRARRWRGPAVAKPSTIAVMSRAAAPAPAVVQRHAGPAVDASREDGRRLVEQHDRGAAAPFRHRLVPGVGDVLGESRHGGRFQQRQEQLLAGAVGGAVQGVHGAVAEEGAENRLGDGAVPVHVPFVVEEADRLRSAQGEGGAAHDPGADHGAGGVAHPVGEPGVALGEERQGAVDQRAAEYVHGGRVPSVSPRTLGGTGVAETTGGSRPGSRRGRRGGVYGAGVHPVPPMRTEIPCQATSPP